MHAIYMTRGSLDAVNNLNEFLKTHPFITKIKTPDGKEATEVRTGVLQPIQLWSFVFPDDADNKEKVLNTLGFTEENEMRWWGKTAKHQAILKALRVGLGAKKAEYPTGNKRMLVDESARSIIAFYPIGIKEDLKNYTRTDGKIGEAL